VDFFLGRLSRAEGLAKLGDPMTIGYGIDAIDAEGKKIDCAVHLLLASKWSVSGWRVMISRLRQQRSLRAASSGAFGFDASRG
jgi:hypothetical protein